MQHLRAAERQDGTGWHYVRGGYPIGYCGQHAPHATEAEARECYGQYLRDHVRLDGRCSWSSCMVKGCGNPANQSARVEGEGYKFATLCAEHLTVEHAIAAMHLEGPAGDAWES